MMAITTNSSINVKADRRESRLVCSILLIQIKMV
jgi:hypothetical protein